MCEKKIKHTQSKTSAKKNKCDIKLSHSELTPKYFPVTSLLTYIVSVKVVLTLTKVGVITKNYWRTNHIYVSMVPSLHINRRQFTISNSDNIILATYLRESCIYHYFCRYAFQNYSLKPQSRQFEDETWIWNGESDNQFVFHNWSWYVNFRV